MEGVERLERNRSTGDAPAHRTSSQSLAVALKWTRAMSGGKMPAALLRASVIAALIRVGFASPLKSDIVNQVSMGYS